MGDGISEACGRDYGTPTNVVDLKLDEFNQITEVASLDEGVRRRIADRVEKRRRI